MLGRQLGRESIEGKTALLGSSLTKRFGDCVLLIKPIGKTN
jgi:hypothetical protein